MIAKKIINRISTMCTLCWNYIFNISNTLPLLFLFYIIILKSAQNNLDEAIIFKDIVLETCSITINFTVKGEYVNYDADIIVIRTRSMINDDDIRLLEFFDNWIFSKDHSYSRCIFYSKNAWLTGEIIDVYFYHNDKKIEFKLLLVYQDTEKYHLNKNHVFPVFRYLDYIEFKLIEPYKKEYAQCTNKVSLKGSNLIEIYNNLIKTKRCFFLGTLDKKYGEVFFWEKNNLKIKINNNLNNKILLYYNWTTNVKK